MDSPVGVADVGVTPLCDMPVSMETPLSPPESSSSTPPRSQLPISDTTDKSSSSSSSNGLSVLAEAASTAMAVKITVFVCLRLSKTATNTNVMLSNGTLKTTRQWLKVFVEKPELRSFFCTDNVPNDRKLNIVVLQLFLLASIFERIGKIVDVEFKMTPEEKLEAAATMIRKNIVERVYGLPESGLSDHQRYHGFDNGDAAFSATFFMLLLQVLTNESTILANYACRR
jgi:hypothetical protein